MKKENLKIMFEIKQDENTSTMLFNTLILMLRDFKFLKEQMELGTPTSIDVNAMNNLLEKAKAIIDVMKIIEVTSEGD